jgi:hypothetical protein
VCSRLGKRPVAVDHARAVETEELGDPSKKTRTGLQKLKSAGTPLQCSDNFQTSAQLEMGPKVKMQGFSKCTTFI